MARCNEMSRIIFFCLAVGLPCQPLFAEEDGLYDCLIEASTVIDVSSPVPGILADITVERGDRVSTGQVLARLESAVEEAALELARERAAFGRRKVVRNKDLYEKQLISIHDKDELETESHLAELGQAEAQLERRTIHSPISGLVVERYLEPGEFVESQPILQIAKLHPLHVEVILPVSRLGTVRKGMRATVLPQAPVGGRYQARVVIVDRVVDAASGTFGVRLILQNPDYRVPAGLKCQVDFSGS